MKQIKKNHDHPNYLPHPYCRPGPGGFENRTTLIEPDVKLRVFNFASKSLPITTPMDWQKIEALAISDQGGVIFVESEHGSVVVKGNSDPAISWFLHQLGVVLSLPLPHKRIVDWKQPEFKLLTKELQRATFINTSLYQSVRASLDRPFLEVQEYIPGISVSSMGPKRALKIMNYYDPKSRHRMIKLGIVLAFDLFINNSERYPLEVWNSLGDVEHMIVRTDPTYTDTTKELRDTENLSFSYEYIYAMDPRPMFVQEYELNLKLRLLQQYYSRTEQFLNNLFIEMKSVMGAQLDPLYETKEQKIECLDQFKRLVYDHTLYEMKEMTLLQVMLGIVLTIDIVVEMGTDRLQQLIESIEIEDDYKGVWNGNLGKINLDFLLSMHSIFRKFHSIHMDVIRWARDITLNQYAFDPELFQSILMMSPKFQKQAQEQIIEKEQQLFGDASVVEENQQQQDNNDDEILEHDLDDGELNRKIKEIFDIDLDDLAKQQEVIKKQEQAPPPIQQPAKQPSYLNKGKYGGMLVSKLPPVQK